MARTRWGLAVILDVVYNHLGPEGCVFGRYAKAYYSSTYANEWGDALNFDGPDSVPVREYFTGNAAYWIDEFHLDGLRFDATQSVHDNSPRHILAVMAEAARRAAGPRPIILVAENERQLARLVRPPERGGYGLDAMWNDDFHHSAVVAITGRREAYYTDTFGTPQEFISAAKHGFLFQGQRYAWQKATTRRAGSGPPTGFVRHVHREPRSDRELGRWLADQVADDSGTVSRHDRAVTADAGDTDALSGAGVRFHASVPLLRGLECRTGGPGRQRSRQLRHAVCEPGLARDSERGFQGRTIPTRSTAAASTGASVNAIRRC
jgi:hypothetical protein